jgi:hypothetical protein
MLWRSAQAVPLRDLSQTALTEQTHIIRCSPPESPDPIQLPADGIIIVWLSEKTGKSQSWKTHIASHSTALAFRDALQAHGYDLFTDLLDDTRDTHAQHT